MGDEAGNASNIGSARHSCCGSCHCHHTRIPWATGPMAGWFPRPGLPWGSGVPAAGSLASDRWEQRLTRVRPWQSKYNFPKKLALPMGFPCRLCDPTGPRAEHGTMHPPPSTGGVDSTRGGRPRLWRSLVTFWRQKVTPAERPRPGRWFAPEKSEKGRLSGQGRESMGCMPY